MTFNIFAIFDLIILAHTLEHFLDIKMNFLKIINLLNTDGLIFVQNL